MSLDPMTLRDFAQFHVPALEADEVRFNVQIAIITAAAEETPAGFSYWTLGAAGHCATQTAGRAILLGNLDRRECRELAAMLSDRDYPGVVGIDETAHWFAEEATEKGAIFDPPIPQRIHVLFGPPTYPATDGSSRAVEPADEPLLFEWLLAFRDEAVPHDPPPERAAVEKMARSGRFRFWLNDDRPVSLAAISRRLRRTAGIAPVYTPPQHRGRGYGGSVTAAVADQAFAEGKDSVCLYTDLRNPISNRCYANIGFRPYCESFHYVRAHS